MASAIRYRMSANLRFNIKSHLDREFVNSGLFVNVASGSYYRPGERQDVLTRVNGGLYESYFDNWLFETDASGVANYPTSVASGVYIDGTFHARGSSPYEPEIDYRRGRVFFNGTAVPESATVTAAFTYKHVLVDYPNSQAHNLINSFLKDPVDFTNNMIPSGTQRQMPVVVIDLQRRIPTPFALGGARQIDQQVVFHVLTSSIHEMEQIEDLLTESSFGVVIRGVDFNSVPVLLTNKGDRASTYKSYTDLQNDSSYTFPKIYIDETRTIEKFELFGVNYARIHWNATIVERTRV